MINIQVKANSIMHSEFGIRFNRDKSLRYKAVSCMHVGAGFVSACFRESSMVVRVPTRGTFSKRVGEEPGFKGSRIQGKKSLAVSGSLLMAGLKRQADCW